MAGTGWLAGWRLTFGGEDLGWEGALATVVEDPDSQVFCVLYDVSRDESRLDRWEGALGLYKKIRLRVQTLEGRCRLAVRPGRLRGRSTLGPLHRRRGRRRRSRGAPDDYVADLRTRPCQGIGP